MNRDVKVLLFAASLRKDSVNARLIELVAKLLANRGHEADVASFSEFDCPLYDGDIEAGEGIPAGAQHLRDRIAASDALVISSPEYNASMPGTLKNLIDWTSRIRPQPFNGNQMFLLSASPSMVGGNRGLWSLRIPLEHLGARVYPDMFSLAQAHAAFGGDGLANETLQKRLDDTLGCFLELVEAAKHYPAMKKQWIEFLGERPDAATDRVETNTVSP